MENISVTWKNCSLGQTLCDIITTSISDSIDVWIQLFTIWKMIDDTQNMKCKKDEAGIVVIDYRVIDEIICQIIHESKTLNKEIVLYLKPTNGKMPFDHLSDIFKNISDVSISNLNCVLYDSKLFEKNNFIRIIVGPVYKDFSNCIFRGGINWNQI